MTQFFSPGGADYANVTITLTFGPTVSTQMATVPILDDSVDEDTEFFNLTLTSTDNAAMLNPSTAIVSIEDSELTIGNHRFTIITLLDNRISFFLFNIIASSLVLNCPSVNVCNIACQSFLVQTLQNAPCKRLAHFLRWNDGIGIQ